MKKLAILLAGLCLIPSLVFGANQCNKRPDDVYSTPISETFLEEGLTFDMVTNFHKDNSFCSSIMSPTQYGQIEIDFSGTWSLDKARIFVHIADASHKTVQKKELNDALDSAVISIRSTPEVSFNQFRSLRNDYLMGTTKVLNRHRTSL